MARCVPRVSNEKMQAPWPLAFLHCFELTTGVQKIMVSSSHEIPIVTKGEILS